MMTFLLSPGLPLEEIASRGHIALFLLRFRVRNAASQVAQSLPLGPARWQTIFQTELQRKSFGSSQLLRLRTSRALPARAPRRCAGCARFAQAQNLGPSKIFPLQRA
jgi:hypothetical protein